MKALILVGGYGTRLRPLTLSVPKPLIDFCNRPIIEYPIRALVGIGVRHVILAVAYQSESMVEALTTLEQKYKVRITCSVETEPLLTAGPIKLAEHLLREDEEGEILPDLFFVFNSDIICNFPLKQLLGFHQKRGLEGTIAVTEIEDPSLYGVVLHDPATGKVHRFVEKPKDKIGNHINAGIYLFRRSVLSRIEARPTSIETEIFPKMATDGQLCCMPIEGYWADIGKPGDFLQGTKLYLEALAQKIAEEGIDEAKVVELAFGPNIIGNVLVHPTSRIGNGCRLGPNVTIGPNCVLGDGVRISNSALMANVKVQDFSWLDNCIVGWNSNIGRWVRIEGLTVLGQAVQIKDECFMNGTFVLPHKAIAESVTTPGTIIM